MKGRIGRLVRTSLIGCGGCIGMAYAFHKLFVRSMSENATYIEAMEMVKNHKGALHLLGEPIEAKKPVLANKGMLLAGFSDVQVRVKGPKSDGVVFLKVTPSASDEANSISIDSIQLQVGKDHSKRLLIKGSPEKVAESKP